MAHSPAYTPSSSRVPSTLPPRVTLGHWQAACTTNSIALAGAEATRQIQAVVGGQQRSAIICDPDSMVTAELTKVATAAFKDVRQSPVIGSVQVSQDLIELFRRCSGNKPLIISDATKVLGCSQMLRLLRDAIDPSGPRKLIVGKGAQQQTINLRVGQIIIAQTDRANVSAALLRDFDALSDLQTPIVIARSAFQRWEYIVWSILIGDALDLSGGDDSCAPAAISAVAAALECFTTNLFELTNISLGTVRKLAAFYRDESSAEGSHDPRIHPRTASLFKNHSTKLQPPVSADWAKLLGQRLAAKPRSTQKLLTYMAASPAASNSRIARSGIAAGLRSKAAGSAAIPSPRSDDRLRSGA